MTAPDLERYLLGGDRSYTGTEAAALAGVTLQEAVRFWRALGFADVGEEVAFTDLDVAALRDVSHLIRSRALDLETAERLVRALGRTTARLAEWQVETLTERVERVEASGRGGGSRLHTGYALAQEVLPTFERLTVHAWRRHLAAAASRLVDGANTSRESLLNITLTVGFADIVSFTRLARGMDEDELAAMVETFERRTSDLVAALGGRIVKTLGDEILFVASDAPTGAEIGLRIVETIGGDPDLPRVRVGMATGSVLTRLGDVFGTTVNVASRLTPMARPNTVVVDLVTAAELRDHGDYDLRQRAPRRVRGLGVLTATVLSRAGQRRPPRARTGGQTG